MTTCSNGLSLWKPFTKASQLFTQKREKAEGKRERETGEEAEERLGDKQSEALSQREG